MKERAFQTQIDISNFEMHVPSLLEIRKTLIKWPSTKEINGINTSINISENIKSRLQENLELNINGHCESIDGNRSFRCSFQNYCLSCLNITKLIFLCQVLSFHVCYKLYNWKQTDLLLHLLSLTIHIYPSHVHFYCLVTSNINIKQKRDHKEQEIRMFFF